MHLLRYFFTFPNDSNSNNNEDDYDNNDEHKKDCNMKHTYGLLSNHERLRFFTNEKVGKIMQIATLIIKQKHTTK